MRNRAVVDLHAISLDDLFAHAGRLLGTSLDSASMRFGGRDNATAGARSDRGTWVRIQQRTITGTAPPARWDAEESAAALAGVRKPAWHRAATWTDPASAVQWRADELDVVTSPVLGWSSGLHDPELHLSDAWWGDLNRSLTALADQPTDRISVDQETITHYITRVFGAVETHVEEWTTAHGDLVWSNVTEDGHLLDWEYWGRAPRGYDAAQLWGVALSRPDLATRIEDEFRSDLNTRSGRIAQLFWCALARCAAEKHPDFAHYRELTDTAVPQLLRSLNRH